MTIPLACIGVIDQGLQFFPLVHEIADFPHELLVPGNDFFGGAALIVEAGRRHAAFERLDGLLVFRDAGLQIGDPPAAVIGRALPSRLFLLSRGALFPRAWGSTPTRLGSRLSPLANAIARCALSRLRAGIAAGAPSGCSLCHRNSLYVPG